MKPLTIVKIGGNVIDDAIKLDTFLSAFAAIAGAKILVHGGGKIATAIGDKLGIQSQYVNGRRITDRETLDLVTMVYGGLINKKIVAALQSKGCNAIGLTGADGNCMLAQKRPIKEVDYGFVGDIVQAGIHADLLQKLVAAGVVPVLAPLTHDGKGNMLNTNADTIAQETAKAIAAIMKVQLIYCFEKKGVLLDMDDDTSLVRKIDEEVYAGLIAKGIISGGMRPKLENAFAAIRQNVSSVVIGHADDLLQLISGKAGTKIVPVK
jgi:acetylglutamate kinase